MRQYNITRTFITAKVTALVVTADDTLDTVEVTLPRYPDDKHLVKNVAAALPKDVSLVRVKSVEKIEALYGMTEETFLANAVALPPRKTAEAQTEA